MSYTLLHATPTPQTYMHLRCITLTPKTLAASKIGLANSLFSVQILASGAAALPSSPSSSSDTQSKHHEEDIVGMGRVIGDGGCFFEVVDICVLPAHQGKGLGKQIMQAIKSWLDENVPASGFVSLLADGKARDLYQLYGFKAYEGGVGMSMEY